MIITTTDNIPGVNYQIISMVSGCSVLSKNFARDFGAGLKNLAGGELKGYTELIDDAQKSAVQRMMENASQMGADAIVAIRLVAPSVTQGGAEIIATGTAVKFI